MFHQENLAVRLLVGIWCHGAWWCSGGWLNGVPYGCLSLKIWFELASLGIHSFCFSRALNLELEILD